jgi:hypothetical protein
MRLSRLMVRMSGIANSNTSSPITDNLCSVPVTVIEQT